MGYHSYSIFHGNTKWMENSSNGCEDNLKIHQMDVKTTFLDGDLKDNVFMFQLEGFVVKGQ
jgi:hypothetical protein